MPLYSTDPMTDPRWPVLLEQHPRASFFHTRRWLDALRSTYHFRPVVYTTSAPGNDLTDGIVFTEVRSWLTGKRLVSLSFSDHCQPLVNSGEEFSEIVQGLQCEKETHGWKYIELRPTATEKGWIDENSGYQVSDEYYYHILDLDPACDTLLKNLHKNCIQRPIRRAEREHLTYREGRDEEIQSVFYRLLLMTRRRHKLPPQPRVWFRNLARYIGENIMFRIAYKEHTPVAGIVSLSFKKTHYYKYGASDTRFKNLGGNVALLWKAILEAKQNGATMFDMGRSAVSNTSLTQFKDRWGTRRSVMHYYSSAPGKAPDTKEGRMARMAKGVFSHLPNPLLTFMGNVLYRHMG